MSDRRTRYGKLVRGWDWRTTSERLEVARKLADWLRISRTNFLEMCIDKELRVIYLTEDNGGGLLIGNAAVGWWDVTTVQEQSSFAVDAQAIVNGDTDNWTADHYDENDVSNPIGNKIVAEWENGVITIVGHYGRAAQAYLRKSEEEFDSQW